MAFSRFFPVQGHDLGPVGTYAGFDVATLPNPGALGTVSEDAGKVYRLVKFDNGQGNVAGVVGGVVHWMDREAFTVTSDQTDAQATINSVAGGLLKVPTDGQYVYVQIGGRQACEVAASTAVGDAMVGSTVDLHFARTASGTAPVGVPWAIAYSAIDTPSTGLSYVYWNLGALL